MKRALKLVAVAGIAVGLGLMLLMQAAAQQAVTATRSFNPDSVPAGGGEVTVTIDIAGSYGVGSVTETLPTGFRLRDRVRQAVGHNPDGHRPAGQLRPRRRSLLQLQGDFIRPAGHTPVHRRARLRRQPHHRDRVRGYVPDGDGGGVQRPVSPQPGPSTQPPCKPGETRSRSPSTLLAPTASAPSPRRCPQGSAS